MSICENCSSLIWCAENDRGNKEACFFFNPTREYQIVNSKEYAVGYEQGRADERAKVLDEFANWLKEKGIHGSKEFTRIIQMYEDELKEQSNE